MNEEREKLVDPYAMTVANLRRRSNAVYLACEAPIAEDISKALRWAADEIERLSEAHAEIQRLQDAKRRALAIADERAKENVALREALKPFAECFEMLTEEDLAVVGVDEMKISDLLYSADYPTIADLRKAHAALAHAPPASEEVRDIRWAINVLLEKIAEKFEGWDTHDIWRSDAAMCVRGFKHTAPEPTDAPDEGPDPLGGEI